METTNRILPMYHIRILGSALLYRLYYLSGQHGQTIAVGSIVPNEAAKPLLWSIPKPGKRRVKHLTAGWKEKAYVWP